MQSVESRSAPGSVLEAGDVVTVLKCLFLRMQNWYFRTSQIVKRPTRVPRNAGAAQLWTCEDCRK
jgi:hypothetical protein